MNTGPRFSDSFKQRIEKSWDEFFKSSDAEQPSLERVPAQATEASGTGI
jgi:hypothetical protein